MKWETRWLRHARAEKENNLFSPSLSPFNITFNFYHHFHLFNSARKRFSPRTIYIATRLWSSLNENKLVYWKPWEFRPPLNGPTRWCRFSDRLVWKTRCCWRGLEDATVQRWRHWMTRVLPRDSSRRRKRSAENGLSFSPDSCKKKEKIFLYFVTIVKNSCIEMENIVIYFVTIAINSCIEMENIVRKTLITVISILWPSLKIAA